VILIGGGAVEAARHVFPGEDGDDTRHGSRPLAANAADPCMRMRRSQHLEVQQPLYRDVRRVTGLPSDDRFGEGGAQAGLAGLAGHVFFGGAHPGKRIGDGAVSSTAAQITLEGVRQIDVLSAIERSGRHDQAGAAEAALECLRVQKGLLHWVERAIFRQAFNGRHFVPGGAECGHQARMYRRSVEPAGARATIAGVAALLYPKAAVLTQEGTQARGKPGHRLQCRDCRQGGVLP
jgi:hypothetical protein